MSVLSIYTTLRCPFKEVFKAFVPYLRCYTVASRSKHAASSFKHLGYFPNTIIYLSALHGRQDQPPGIARFQGRKKDEVANFPVLIPY